MLKKYLKSKLPNIHELQKKYNFGFLAKHLFQPHLWYFHRVDVARGLALGLLVGMTPLPAHTLIVPFIAIFLWPANLPIALVAIWITNPVTLAPISYLEYKLGIRILGWHEQHFHLEWSWKWFEKEFIDLWVPMMLGSLVMGIILAVVAYWLVLLISRVVIVYRWTHRPGHRGSI